MDILEKGRRYALYPWEEDPWGPEERREEIETLKQVLKLEREAVEAIAKVVKNMGSS